MLTKLAILAIAAWVGWRLLKRAVIGPKRTPQRIDALNAERCPVCGVHRIAGRPCDCKGISRR